MLFIHIIMSIKDSLQQQIHFNGNIFWNKCWRFNEGPCTMTTEMAVGHTETADPRDKQATDITVQTLPPYGSKYAKKAHLNFA